MLTRKPFSTISYNTDDFLKTKLDELVASRKLDFYCFITHFPEDDETKAHKHVYFVPNGILDTCTLFNELIEIDPQNPTKPLKCIMAHSSRFEDWYLYALHHVEYLASKGQSRKHHYVYDDIVSSDSDYLLELTHQIDYAKLTRFSLLKNAIENNISFGSLMLSGAIPIQQAHAYKTAYSEMQTYITYRNGKPGHENYNDVVAVTTNNGIKIVKNVGQNEQVSNKNDRCFEHFCDIIKEEQNK